MEPPDTPDYYDDLGVERTATAQEIRRAHNVLALKHHPDKLGPGYSGNGQEFQKIRQAFEVLRENAMRGAYDLNYEILRQKWDRYRAWQKHQAQKEAERQAQEAAERQAQEEAKRQQDSQSSWTREARRKAERDATPNEAQEAQWEAFLVEELMTKERIAAKWMGIRTRRDKEVDDLRDRVVQNARDETCAKLRKREEEVRKEMTPFFEEEERKAIAKAISGVQRRFEAIVRHDVEAFQQQRKKEEERIINSAEQRCRYNREMGHMKTARRQAEEERKAMDDFQARIREWQEDEAAKEAFEGEQEELRRQQEGKLSTSGMKRRGSDLKEDEGRESLKRSCLEG